MKTSLIIGINDYQTQVFGNLFGCENDADDWDLLLTALGFKNIDKVIKGSEATHSLIQNQLIHLMNQLKNDDDVAVIVYSGHGGRLKDRNGDETNGGKDAYIATWDNNILLDDEIYKIINERPNQNSKVIFISDSCYSGSIIASMTPAVLIERKKELARAIETYKSFNMLKPEIKKIQYYKQNLEAEPRINKAIPAELKFSVPSPDVMDNIIDVAADEIFTNRILLASSAGDTVSREKKFENKIQGIFSYFAKKIIRSNRNISFEDLIKKINLEFTKENIRQSAQIDGDHSLRQLNFLSVYNKSLIPEHTQMTKSNIFPQKISEVNTSVPLSLITNVHDRCQIVHFDMTEDLGFTLIAKIKDSELKENSCIIRNIDFSVVTAFNTTDFPKVLQIDTVELLSPDDKRRTAHEEGDVDILVKISKTATPDNPLRIVNLNSPFELFNDKSVHTTIYIDNIPLFDPETGTRTSGGGSCSATGATELKPYP